MFPNLLLLTFSIAMAGLISEVALRIFYPSLYLFPSQHVIILNKGDNCYLDCENAYITDRDIIYRRNPANGVYNELGIWTENGKLEERLKTARKKVLVVGDSVTEQAVLFEDGFTKSMERVLIKESGYGKVVVMNAGVGGWNSCQERIYLKKWGFKTNPDLIVLAFVNNDLTPPLAHHHYSDRIEIEYLNSICIPLIVDFGRFNFFVFDHSHFLALLFLNLEKMAKHFGIQLSVDYYHPVTEKNKKSLQQIVDLVKKKQIPLLIVHFPVFQNLDDYSRNPEACLHELLKKFCLENRVPYLDLLENFRGMKGQDVCRDPNSVQQIHPNNKGHKIAGEAIADFILKNGIL